MKSKYSKVSDKPSWREHYYHYKYFYVESRNLLKIRKINGET